MTHFKPHWIIAIMALVLFAVSCKKNNSNTDSANASNAIVFDSTQVNPYFQKHPKLQKYKAEVLALYQKQQFQHIWFDADGTNEVADLLYNKIINLDDEGLPTTVPYRSELDAIFDTENSEKPNVNSELLISSLFFFFANKVYKGISVEKSKELGWYLPRKKQSFVNYLDSILLKPALMNKDEKEVLGQYYRLREALQFYRNLQKKENWNPISLDAEMKKIAPNDSAQAIISIRKRLFLLGDLDADSQSAFYDEPLVNALLKYKKRNGLDDSTTISEATLAHLNVSLTDRIRTIMVNMERCRWISNNFTKSDEIILINIPSYTLRYLKKNKTVLESKVVVGKAMHKTVVFQADMKYIVFNPYWNVPKSILNREILPAIEKDPNYLEKNDMEWYKGMVRQRPGPKNSLGQIKFLFPNSNSIYLHDTPSKSLFEKDKRAFSHGCIRVEKRNELVQLILESDPNWTPEKIANTFAEGKEKWYNLKKKIPVFIGYFTAWVDPEGQIHFYEDIYQRDKKLAAMIVEK